MTTTLTRPRRRKEIEPTPENIAKLEQLTNSRNRLVADAAYAELERIAMMPVTELPPLASLELVDLYTVTLHSHGNPDHAQYAPVSDPAKVTATKLADIVLACQAYIEYWNLGGGNWPRCIVRKNGKPYCWVGYNRRIFDLKDVPMDGKSFQTINGESGFHPDPSNPYCVNPVTA